MLRKTCLVLALLLSLPVAASATPLISAGTHILQPNTPGQVIAILVSGLPGDPILDQGQVVGGGEAFAGVNLSLMVEDGTFGPTITGVDLVGAGTVLAGNNNGQQDYSPFYVAPGREIVAYATTSNGYVGPNGVLAFLEIDTTGVLPGEYDLHLSHSVFGQSDLPPFFVTDTLIEDGLLQVVPEPSSVVLGVFAMAGLGAFAIRRRRA